MKNLLPVVLGAALFASVASAQTAYTDPVGYITITVPGSAGGTPRLTLAGLGMVNPVEFQGAVSTATGTTLTFAGTPFTASAFNAAGANAKFYVEVVSTGLMTDIVSNTVSDLTVSDDLSLAADTVVRIRAHHTLASLFGATNSAGFQGGANATSADSILIIDKAAGTAVKSFFYSTVFSRWVPSDNIAGDATNTVVYPDQGMLISRRGTTDLSIRNVGAVRVGKAALGVAQGQNIVPNSLPVAVTLATSNLYNTGGASTSLVGGANAVSADEVLLIGTDGSVKTFFYSTVFSRWVPGDNIAGNADAQQIPVGAALLVNRKSATAFNWVQELSL